MILRNAAYNLLGMGLPIAVALLAIPLLVSALGVEKFGMLTLIWAVVSYFGLFDLGLGRALTQQVAVLHQRDPARLKPVLVAANALLLTLGLCGGLCLAVAAAFVAGSIAPSADSGETARSMLWVAAAMPFVVLTSGYRGALEGLERFGIVNALRVPMGVAMFALPLGVVALGYPQLDVIAASLCLGRAAGWAAHAVCAERALPGAARLGRPAREPVRSLLRLGGGISVSNIVAPLMNYIDRFILAGVGSLSSVAYYATPQELVNRLGVIPSALATALFPRFAAWSSNQDLIAQQNRFLWVMVALTTPFALVLVFGAYPILEIWIDADFARQAAIPLQIMALGVVPSAVAQVPFATLQARGRADVTALLHLIELPFYVGMIWLMASAFGAVGAAAAWLIRVVLDAIALQILARKLR